MKTHTRHDPHDQGEVMTAVQFPEGLPELILKSLDCDIDVNWKGDAKTTAFNNEQRQQCKLFGKTISEVLSYRVAKLALHGEKKEADEAVDLVARFPNILRYKVEVEDLLKRKMWGTPLEIVFMAGDVDLKKNIYFEEERGIAERFIKASNLTSEEIVKQLQVVTSEEACRENARRNKSIVSAITAFGEEVLALKIKDTNISLHELQAQPRCQELINQLEQKLQESKKEVISCGFVFDIQILYSAMRCFHMRSGIFFPGDSLLLKQFFLISGYGRLQMLVSSRDAQVINAGLCNFIDEALPQRTLRHSDGARYFFNSTSPLGTDFYLNYYGHYFPDIGLNNLFCALNLLIRNKNNSIERILGQHLPQPSVPITTISCVIC